MIALLNATMTKILSGLTAMKVAQSVGQSDGKSSAKARDKTAKWLGIIPNQIRCCRSEKPQGAFRQTSGIRVSVGWRSAYPTYSNIKKIIGKGIRSRQQGFTLLEVMVALAILSVASAGLITATGGYLKQSQKVEEKVIAAWVADNWLNELRLAETTPDSDEVKAEANMAGREWLLSAQVIDTASEHLKRLEIKVRRADDGDKGAVLSQLTAFLRSKR